MVRLYVWTKKDFSDQVGICQEICLITFNFLLWVLEFYPSLFICSTLHIPTVYCTIMLNFARLDSSRICCLDLPAHLISLLATCLSSVCFFLCFKSPFSLPWNTEICDVYPMYKYIFQACTVVRILKCFYVTSSCGKSQLQSPEQ